MSVSNIPPTIVTGACARTEKLKSDQDHSNAVLTVGQMLEKTVEKKKDWIAFSEIEIKKKDNQSEIEKKTQVTWSQFAQNSKSIAKSLIALDVKPGSVVTTQGTNSINLITANVGIMLAGGISAGIYPSNGIEATQHVVKNNNGQVVMVEDEEQLKKYRAMEATSVKCFVTWQKIHGDLTKDFSAPVYSLEEFLALGENVSNEQVNQRMKDQKPDDVVALIQTSGTMGLSKAVKITHKNLHSVSPIANYFGLKENERGISYLPVSHVAAFLLDIMFPIKHGVEVTVVPNAFKDDRLKLALPASKPTYFLAVPRVWEKFMESAKARLEKEKPERRKFVMAVMNLTRKSLKRLQKIQQTSKWSLHKKIASIFYKTIIVGLAELILLKKIKGRIGLSHCRNFASGAGPLSKEVADFMLGLNIPIVQIYGMSETTGPATVGRFDTPLGSCGKPLAGVEIKIVQPDQKEGEEKIELKNGEGEIRLKGDGMTSGYLNNDEATKDLYDNEGYLKTGDLGWLDEKGNLSVTGRIKELIKTSGGELISPIIIEEHIKEKLGNIVSNVLVVGDKRNYISAIMTLPTKSVDGLSSGELTNEVVQILSDIGSKATTLAQAAEDPIVVNYLIDRVKKEVNPLAISGAQHVQKVAIVTEEFSTENCTMTPTGKLKRRYIEHEAYKGLIDKMYA